MMVQASEDLKRLKKDRSNIARALRDVKQEYGQITKGLDNKYKADIASLQNTYD